MKKDGDLGLHTPERRQLMQAHDTRFPISILRGKEQTVLHASEEMQSMNKFEKQY